MDTLKDTLKDHLRVASRPLLLAVTALPLIAATARVQDAGTVRLAVRTADGAPLVGAHVTRANAPITLDTDERGVITVQRVPTGGAWLHVRRLGYRRATFCRVALEKDKGREERIQVSGSRTRRIAPQAAS